MDAYDSLQLLVVGNLLWCIAWPIPIFLASAVGLQLEGDEPPSAAQTTLVVSIALVAATFLVGPATMALAALTQSITTRQDPRLVDFFRGFRRFYLRGAGLFAINVAVATIWGANVFFWSSRGPGGARIGQLGSLAVVTLFSYGMLYWVLMQMYCPALIAREDIGVLRATKRAAVLVLGNLGYSALVFIQVAVLAAVIALPVFVPVGVLMGLSFMVILFLAAAFAMLLGTAALEDLMQQYEGKGDRNDDRCEDSDAEDAEPQ